MSELISPPDAHQYKSEPERLLENLLSTQDKFEVQRALLKELLSQVIAEHESLHDAFLANQPKPQLKEMGETMLKDILSILDELDSALYLAEREVNIVSQMVKLDMGEVARKIDLKVKFEYIQSIRRLLRSVLNYINSCVLTR